MRPETVNNFSLQLFHIKGKLIEMFYEFVEKAAIAHFSWEVKTPITRMSL